MTDVPSRHPHPDPLWATGPSLATLGTAPPVRPAPSGLVPHAGEGDKGALRDKQVKRGCVVVGMSGGVDSAVTALLLKQQGYDVIGLFMKNWEDDNTDEYCSSRQDLIDAASVADTIGIPLEAVNFSREYKERVFSYFLREYQAGRTPNPDILCNSEIKFKAFLDHAVTLGADKIATGHYAQVREVDGLFQLLKADDASKDQSYFLHKLNQAQLSKAMFPLGNIQKSQVRKIAEEHKLSNYAKKDSTGICFIGERPFREFLGKYLPTRPGDMCTPEGKVVGKHVGLSFYTIGQRQGLGIGGTSNGGQGLPWFVADKDMANNKLIVVQGHDHPLLLKPELSAMEMHWISGTAADTSRDYAAKTRYRQEDAPCHIEVLQDGNARFSFTTPQWAVTPGQSVVAYDGAVCIGGGIIL